MGFPSGAVVKNPPANAGDARDTGSLPGLGQSPGEGNDNPLWYSCLGNPMDRGAWQATAHRCHDDSPIKPRRETLCSVNRLITI